MNPTNDHEKEPAMTQSACESRYVSTEGPTAGAVIACRKTGLHTIHSNLADDPYWVNWVTGDDDEVIRLRCDWCRNPYATHNADEHPLPRDHADYDAFFDATDTELAGMAADAMHQRIERESA